MFQFSGGEAREPGGPVQVGGSHPRRRRGRHGRGGAHAVPLGVRSGGEPAQLRQARRGGRQEHQRRAGERGRLGGEGRGGQEALQKGHRAQGTLKGTLKRTISVKKIHVELKYTFSIWRH